MNKKFWLNVVAGALSLVMASAVSFSAGWIRNLSREQARMNERLARIETALKITTKESDTHVAASN